MIEFRVWMIVPVLLLVAACYWVAYQLGEPRTVWFIDLITGWNT